MGIRLQDIEGWLRQRCLVDKERLIRWLSANVQQVDGCMVWTGDVNPTSKYGDINLWVRGVGNRKVYAHRLFWVLANKRNIPPGMEVEHNCPRGDRTCVLHLSRELIDHGENGTRANVSRAEKRRRTTLRSV